MQQVALSSMGVTEQPVKRDMSPHNINGQDHKKQESAPTAVNASIIATLAPDHGLLHDASDAKADIIIVTAEEVTVTVVAKHAQATRAVTALMFPANPVITSKAV